MSPLVDNDFGQEKDIGKDEQDALSVLRQFLNDCDHGLKEKSRRRECPSCTASRSMYCYDCCEVLIPLEDGPRDLGELQLPCAVDIILDDRRASATGVQAMAVLNKTRFDRKLSDTDDDDVSAPRYRLLDQSRGDGIPDDYSDEEGVYVLFPSSTSVGISSVGALVRRLVVLDCKWSKSYIRDDPRISRLPKVHLDNPPEESFYWRWHNSGSGMLCTIEAIYFAAWQLAEQRGWSLARRQTLVNLFWIFGTQRAVIREQYQMGNGHRIIPYMPFSEDGKAYARKLRNKEVHEAQQETKRNSS